MINVGLLPQTVSNLGKHEAFTQCCFNVVSASLTLKQHFGECLVSSGMVHVARWSIPTSCPSDSFFPTLSQCWANVSDLGPALSHLDPGGSWLHLPTWQIRGRARDLGGGIICGSRVVPGGRTRCRTDESRSPDPGQVRSCHLSTWRARAACVTFLHVTFRNET